MFPEGAPPGGVPGAMKGVLPTPGRGLPAYAKPKAGNRRDFDFAATIAKKPHYGVIVVVVGALSIAIPLTVFLLLHTGSSNDPPPERTPAEVVSDRVPRADPPRPKASSSARPPNRRGH
jgi:hypothetical protein